MTYQYKQKCVAQSHSGRAPGIDSEVGSSNLSAFPPIKINARRILLVKVGFLKSEDLLNSKTVCLSDKLHILLIEKGED